MRRMGPCLGWIWDYILGACYGLGLGRNLHAYPTTPRYMRPRQGSPLVGALQGRADLSNVFDGEPDEGEPRSPELPIKECTLMCNSEPLFCLGTPCFM